MPIVLKKQFSACSMSRLSYLETKKHVLPTTNPPNVGFSIISTFSNEMNEHLCCFLKWLKKLLGQKSV